MVEINIWFETGICGSQSDDGDPKLKATNAKDTIYKDIENTPKYQTGRGTERTHTHTLQKIPIDKVFKNSNQLNCKMINQNFIHHECYCSGD